MPTRILVVDDEPQFERLILQRFRRRIKEGHYDFAFAHDGLEALNTLEKEEGIDIVLSDINMPKMDGLTLIAELHKKYPLIKTVMVSAYGDMENIRTAMNQGAFDFVTKPIEFEDLEVTIKKTLNEIEVGKQAAQARILALKNEQLQELGRLNSVFFTNISHEFRTPLTVIAGMAEQIKEDPGQWLEKGADMIRRNTDNLLNLVNQILDLRKLEAGKLQLQWQQGDIVSYLKYIYESFHALSLTRDLQLHFLADEQEVVMDYDAEKMLRIVSNLLSNALKFTPPGGNVYLMVGRRPAQDGGDPVLLITVRDTGVGISEDKLPQIFERFYSLEGEGNTGIGMALARELVHLMGGQIQVESQLGAGTSFFIRLPIRRKAEVAPGDSGAKGPIDPGAFAGQMKEENDILRTEAADHHLPSLLLVEDHPDVRQFLLACLEGHYRLETARDGQEGIDKALDQVPDIIVSDVMMPRKDGLELCQALKADERTSHIPIILLTARADVESRIAGLERGADAYLTKPFQKQELLTRLAKLLELRLQLQARYRAPDAVGHTDDKGTQIEDAFIRRAREAVEANIDDENFGILQLCRAVGLSRSQLHNKIKALTGRSTSLFVRSIRLHKARQLLLQPEMNVSQVAYEVGFKDPKYFSRTYVEEFGETPLETMRKQALN